MKIAAALAGLVLLAGCASASDGPPGGASPTRGPRRPPPNVFISPSGEPFRSEPDAPYASTPWFQGADTNGDGRLTPAEFLADAERAFRKLDTNGDGVIDGFEINAYEETVAPEILPRLGRLRAGEGMDDDLFHDRNGGVRGGGSGRRRGDSNGGGGGRIRAADIGYSGAGAFGMLAEPEPLKAADADLDGRVSLAEWRARTRRRFELLDGKSRGVLTLDQLPKTYVQQERERRAGKPAR